MYLSSHPKAYSFTRAKCRISTWIGPWVRDLINGWSFFSTPNNRKFSIRALVSSSLFSQVSCVIIVIIACLYFVDLGSPCIARNWEQFYRLYQVYLRGVYI